MPKSDNKVNVFNCHLIFLYIYLYQSCCYIGGLNVEGPNSLFSWNLSGKLPNITPITENSFWSLIIFCPTPCIVVYSVLFDCR